MTRTFLPTLACLGLLPLAAWADEPPVPPIELIEPAPEHSPLQPIKSSRRGHSAPTPTTVEDHARPVPVADDNPVPAPSTQGPADVPGRLPTSLPKRAPKIDRLPQASRVDDALPNSVSRELPRQIPAYEATSVPEGIDTLVDGNSAEPLEPLGRQTEIIRERYPDGKIRIERHVTQDENRNYLNHGPWTMWDRQGNIVAQGKYHFGRQDGQWVRRYFVPRDSLLQQPWLQGFERPVTSVINFVDGQLHGPWTIVDARGRPVATWNFENGQLHGPATWWFANGQKMRIANYVRGVPHGDFTEWRPNGTIVSQKRYEEGRSFTRVTKYDRTGNLLVEGWHVNPVEEHRLGYDWWAGELLIDVAVTEGESLRTGIWTYYYYPTGQKQYEGEFHEGDAIGVHTWWYPNGQRSTRGNYHAGKPHGTWTWWYANGQRRIEGRYLNGEYDRGWVGWTEQGNAIPLDESQDVLPMPPALGEEGGDDWSSAKATDRSAQRRSLKVY
mgnify:FL=1